jgi:hypothetical protein
MTRMSQRRAPLHRRLRHLAVVAGGLVALGTAACAEPALPDAPQGEGADRPVEVDAPDPARDALVAQLGELRATVAAARDELASALEPADSASARRAGDRAVAVLLEGGSQAGGTSPLFPSTTTERGDLGSEDELTATLTAARDAGGTLGRAAVEALRDPIAGDLGTWQRDPAGVVATVRDTASSRSTLEALERAVLELPGEGTRALAWALLTADARDRDSAAAYAERGVAHLDIILATLDDLLAEGSVDEGSVDQGEGDEGSDGGDDGTADDGADEEEA